MKTLWSSMQRLRCTVSTLGDAFRIFTDKVESGDIAPDTRFEPEPDEEEIVAYTDGSATDNGKENARAGSGVYFGDEDIRNLEIRIPEDLEQSNQMAEILAIKECCEKCPNDIPLTIMSDSLTMIEGLTKNLESWENEDFLSVANGETIKITVARMRERKAETYLKWVKGHAGIKGNEAADVLANNGRLKDTPDTLDMKVRADLVLPGAKLNVMTQSLAYKIIRQRKMKKEKYKSALERKITKRNMALAKGAASNFNNESTPAKAIWKGSKHKDFGRNIHFFFWMAIHGGYKIGEHWKSIADFEDWGVCKECEITESMDHILTKCDAPGQALIWDLVKKGYGPDGRFDVRVGDLVAVE
jgi:ribonuclease HI